MEEGIETDETIMADKNYRVAATALNLRSSPSSSRRANIIAALPQGHEVRKLDEAGSAWWRVAARFREADLEAFVAHRYLAPASEITRPQAVGGVAAVHLEEGRPTIRRDRADGHAYPLGEPGRPARRGEAADEKRRGLAAITDWLGVERSPRYQKRQGATYCNVYTYDYCYLGGAYLPRVWWRGPALEALASGRSVVPAYGETVHELNANALYDWLDSYGPRFGWTRLFDLDTLQEAANEGEVCVICAQRRELNRSGHIAVVVAEDAAHQAARDGHRVRYPLQGQAGLENFGRRAKRSAWWASNTFRAFGFWQHP